MRARKKDVFKNPNRGLSSVSRTLMLMEILSLEGPSGITELALKMHCAKSSVYRMLSTLEKKRYVVQDEENGRYDIGSAFFIHTQNYLQKNFPMDQISSVLKNLSKIIGQNAYFAILSKSRDKVIVIAEETADRAIIANPILYQTFPLYVLPAGIIYLSCQPDEKLGTILSALFQNEKTKPLVSVKQIMKFIRDCRKKGFSILQNISANGVSELGVKAANNSNWFLAIRGPSPEFKKNRISEWFKILHENAKLLNCSIA